MFLYCAWLGLALAGCDRPLWPGLGLAGLGWRTPTHTAHTHKTHKHERETRTGHLFANSKPFANVFANVITNKTALGSSASQRSEYVIGWRI